ncbi:MAG: hypothetical protein H7Z43_00670 [Clostridia bacterium]|nr:hypothetical protein [Deltaproteobacteria bacterium]
MDRSSRIRPLALPVLSAMAIFFSACDDTDVGEICPQLLGDAAANDPANLVTTNADGTSDVTETYGTSAAFPCESLLCVAADGRPGYCTVECRDDGACPDGFACKSISGGVYARNVCIWKTCTSDKGCGDGKVCRSVPNVIPGEDFKLCTFAD